MTDAGRSQPNLDNEANDSSPTGPKIAKRGRGRPRRDAAHNPQIQVNTTGVKRGPGRPPKRTLQDSRTEANSSVTKESRDASPKEGEIRQSPGRARPKLLDEYPERDGTNTDTNTRGRPRRDTNKDNSQPKRGRGRPRKGEEVNKRPAQPRKISNSVLQESSLGPSSTTHGQNLLNQQAEPYGPNSDEDTRLAKEAILQLVSIDRTTKTKGCATNSNHNNI